MFLLEGDEGLARQITRAADRALDNPAVECFTAATDLVAALERATADVIILDEDSSTSAIATVIQAVRKHEGGRRAEIVVLSRSWENGPSGLAQEGVRELPKPINMQVLTSVLRSAGSRSRSSRPPALS